jgi:peptide/nickel transport system substrate-binding protein
MLTATALAIAACGGGDDGGDGAGPPPAEEGAAGVDYPQFVGDLADAEPTYGGSVTFGLEAETGGGWCVPEAQLAISGIQVARAVYDTLTVPDGDGAFQPHLAESVEPNDDHTEWTITLRDGIQFHDGTDLDAEVLKNNFDAVTGNYEGISPTLLSIVMADIEETTVVDDMTVQVDMRRPWVSFDSFLYLSGRFGIVGQAQLDSDECARELIGTGPFELDNWNTSTQVVTVSRNDNYWRTDEEGNALPYLDEIVFNPMPDGQARVNALFGGEIDLTHMTTNTEAGSYGEMIDRAERGDINFVHSAEFAEVGFLMLNSGEPPFDDPIAREAVAVAINRELINETLYEGRSVAANGPFAPGSLGYVEDTGAPTYDPERAQELVEQYEAEHGEPLEFRITSTPQPALIELVDMTAQMFEEVGMRTRTNQVDQSELINTAVGGGYEMMTFRNYPGLDPDNLYVWWHSEGAEPGTPNLINFMNFEDEEVDRLLDEGRVTADEDEREQIYQDLNRHLAEQNYMLWASWTNWSHPSAADVYNQVGARHPDAPDDGSEDYTGFALGVDPALLWRAG